MLQSKGETITSIGIIMASERFVRFIANPLWGLIADQTQQHKLVMILNVFLSIIFLIVCVFLVIKKLNSFRFHSPHILQVIFLKKKDWNSLVWLAYFLFLLSGFFRTPTTTLLDHMTLEVLGENKDSYGRQRIFGVSTT